MHDICDPFMVRRHPVKADARSLALHNHKDPLAMDGVLLNSQAARLIRQFGHGRSFIYRGMIQLMECKASQELHQALQHFAKFA